MKIYLLAIFFILSGCAHYIQSVHRQIDRDEGFIDPNKKSNDPYQLYRDQGFKSRQADARPIQDPRTMQESGIRRNNQSDILPTVQRNYKPQNYRHTSKDFIDNDSNGSLWASNSAGSLYGAESTKRPGDIVIINVLDNLRSQISNELKRAFPVTKKSSKPDGASASSSAPPTPGASAPSGSAADTELETKVYDKISGIIVEEVSEEYVLVKGKKEVIFRKEKRYIEIQALVSRRDIQDNDTISSDKVLESRVNILR